MKLEGTYAFRGPRPAVWDLLQDPDVLARAIPGARRLERTGDDRYEGTMKVSLGPVGAEFSLVVTLRDKVPPEHFAMDVDSKGTLGFSRGTALVHLDEAAEGGTTMRYTADLQIGGRLAAIGQRVVDSAARSMTQKGLEGLQRELDARLARTDEDAAP